MSVCNNVTSHISSLDRLAEVAAAIGFMDEGITKEISKFPFQNSKIEKSDSCKSSSDVPSDDMLIKSEELGTDNTMAVTKNNLEESIIADNFENVKTKKSFPELLMDILLSKNHEDVISWLPQGNAFIVLDKIKLVEYVLPLYFKEIKYKSFVTRLQRWGFKRFLNGQGECKVFYHKRFLRDSPNLCKLIHMCVDVKYTAVSIVKQKRTTGHHPNSKNIMQLESLGQQHKAFDEAKRLEKTQELQNMSAINSSHGIISNIFNSPSLDANYLIQRYFDRKMDQIRSYYFPTKVSNLRSGITFYSQTKSFA